MADEAGGQLVALDHLDPILAAGKPHLGGFDGPEQRSAHVGQVPVGKSLGLLELS